jgi:hypothetical protein
MILAFHSRGTYKISYRKINDPHTHVLGGGV